MNAIDKPPAEAAAAQWLAGFNAAGPAERAALFLEDSHARDVLALGWELRTVSGADAVAGLLAGLPGPLRVAPGRTAPRRVSRAGQDCIEVLLEFEAGQGPGQGVLRLVQTAEGWRGWTILVALAALGDHPQGPRHAAGADFSREFGGPNWADHRARTQAYEGRDPAVLVVGAGQAGLSIAARLGQQGIDTLVIDRQARTGDNWRRRYHALTLHNEVHVNHLPYMPFPPTWPVFIPKDKLANWFEAYAEAMELNIWCGSALESGEYRDGAWDVVVRREGEVLRLRPRHVIFATGVSSIPKRPALPGLSEFRGEVMHSGTYTEGSAWKGRPALVLGSGNSGHDVAHDLHASGARVSIVQRGTTHIVSLAEAQRVYSIYAEGIPTEDCDLLATATPFPVLKRAYQHATAISKRADAALHAALAARGFRLDDGPEGCGFQMKYMQEGGGYYFNVGCSDLIAAGDIGLVQYADIASFEAGGARLRDGSLVEAELLVLATGYHNQQETVRACLGDAVAERVGPVWGFDAGGELRNMWRPTAQPGLWFTAGSLAQCRIYSRYLAMQIKVRELELV
jgi:putative flavoprotein involved in K+ transport